MSKYICEMVFNNMCLGCAGLGERDWVGKYQCKHYKELKRKMIDDYKNSFTMQVKKKQ